MNRYAPMLLLLAAIWGASYLFIKVAVEDIQPAPLMAARTLGAAALLLSYLAWRLGREGAIAALRTAWRHCLVLGVLNAALPFWLVAWGEQHIDSGLAAVLQSSVPIFNALILLKVVPHERLSMTRAVGLGIGISGVAIVTGIHPDGGTWAIVGALAVVLSSISYGSAGVYGQLAVSGTPGPVLAAGSMLCGGLILLPVALFQLPASAPGWEAVGSLLAPDAPRHGACAADPLPDARAPRLGAARARHLPDAGVRARLRRADPRRGDHFVDARRARPDPRRRRARFRRGQPAAALGRPRTVVSVSIRRARPDDLDFLVELYEDEDVRPFLAASGAYDRDGIAEKIARADEEPDAGGLLIVEEAGEQAGAMAWDRKNIRSRVAHVGGLAVHPSFRGRRLADDAARLLQRHLIRELGFHRIELEIYGFNERAQRHAERRAGSARA